MIQAISARTTFRNTPETDLMPTVYHTVNYSTETGAEGIAYVRAKDPQDAIRQINHMRQEDMSAYSIMPLSN